MRPRPSEYLNRTDAECRADMTREERLLEVLERVNPPIYRFAEKVKFAVCPKCGKDLELRMTGFPSRDIQFLCCLNTDCGYQWEY